MKRILLFLYDVFLEIRQGWSLEKGLSHWIHVSIRIGDRILAFTDGLAYLATESWIL